MKGDEGEELDGGGGEDLLKYTPGAKSRRAASARATETADARSTSAVEWRRRGGRDKKKGEKKRTEERGRTGRREEKNEGARERGLRREGNSGEKDAGVAEKGAAPATNFRVRGHCDAGAWPRRRSKRKIDAVRGDEKQRARAPRRRPSAKKKERKEDG